MAVLGRPMVGPVMASISGMVYPSLSADSRPKDEATAKKRLPMKLGVSLQTTTPLPSVSLPNVFMKSTTSGAVSAVGMISSSFR